MARTDNLTNFLTDIANIIRQKKVDGESNCIANEILNAKIEANTFDDEIIELPSYRNLNGEHRNYIFDAIQMSENPITSIDFQNTQPIILGYDAEFLFAGYDTLQSILNLDSLQTYSCLSFKQMFSGCGITSLNLGFNTDSAVNFYGMCQSCPNLESVEIGFDAREGKDFSNMFQGCENLSSITGIDMMSTSNGIDFSFMFQDCRSLTSLDLGTWDLSNAKDITNMFNLCTSLEFLNVSQFEFSNIENTNSCLADINTNCEIIVKDDTEKNWVLNNYPELQNVKTVAEYEASLNE